MISENIPQPMDEDLVGPYFLWKLLIDHRCQRRGYGAAALDAVVDYLRTRPGSDVLYTSCTDGPGSPRGFYLRYGFTDTSRVMGARTSSRSTSRRKADGGSPRSPPRLSSVRRAAPITQVCAGCRLQHNDSLGAPNGGSRLPLDRGASPTSTDGIVGDGALSDGRDRRTELFRPMPVIGRLLLRRRRRCRWRAGPGCRGPGRTASWFSDQHARRPLEHRAAGPRHRNW
jgi:hypothetical protein